MQEASGAKAGQVIDWPIDKIVSAGNRRGAWSEEKIRQRAQNIKAVGLLEPLEGYIEDGLVHVTDGNGRLEAQKLNGETTTRVRVIAKPSVVELAAMQASKDLHHESFPMGAKCRVAAEWKKLAGVSTAELARRAGISPSLATKLVTVADGDPLLLELLDQGKLTLEPAYKLVTSEPDLVKQREKAQAMTGLSRDKAMVVATLNGKPEIKTTSARVPLHGGYLITVKGPEFTMTTLQELLDEGRKLVRKADAAGHDVASIGKFVARKGK